MYILIPLLWVVDHERGIVLIFFCDYIIICVSRGVWNKSLGGLSEYASALSE